MAAISGVGAPSPAVRTGTTSALADYGQFLKLFVSQLKYQDPLSPLGGSEFLAETAQFSTVEQLVNLNRKMGDSSGSMAALGRSTAAALIGRLVEAEGLDPDGGEASWSGRVVRVEYAADGTITLGLEDGTAVPFSGVVSVSET